LAAPELFKGFTVKEVDSYAHVNFHFSIFIIISFKKIRLKNISIAGWNVTKWVKIHWG